MEMKSSRGIVTIGRVSHGEWWLHWDHKQTISWPNTRIRNKETWG